MGIEVSIKKKLGDFSLSLDLNESSKRIGILGSSGSGKSMTLKCIAGIECPDSGRIAVNGRVYYDSASGINLIPQKRNTGYLFQNYALFPTMSVYKNIASGLRHKDKEKVKERVSEMIRKFRLSGLEDRLPSELSGGQQQRTALARIMAYEPEAILLDEPFSALDMYLKDHMQEELMELLSDYEGLVIMVSHSRDEIFRFSDRLLIIDEGRVAAHGNTRELFASPGSRAAARLTGCKNFSHVTVLSDHILRADDWGIELKLEGKIPEGTEYIGYRAHEFEPLWGDREENSIRFSLSSKAELQFEKNYYIKPEKEDFDRESLITWFVQRDRWKELSEKGLPTYLKFREKDIMFLKRS